MSRFTKEIRQRIVQKFAVRHNGQFDPALFIQEVRATGAEHPAYDWFEWDVGNAAQAYQLEQARAFARDLRVTFRVEEITGPHSVRIKEEPMPMVISPISGRNKGGGYVLVDPNDPEHIAEHCVQAARALAQWRDRYAAAIAHVGVKKSRSIRSSANWKALGPREKRAERAVRRRSAATVWQGSRRGRHDAATLGKASRGQARSGMTTRV